MRYAAPRGRNEVVVHFQRRDDLFTCDLGATLAVLKTVRRWSPPEHWRIRLGPPVLGYDRWWALTDDVPAVAAEFLPVLTLGLEHIEPLATEEGLRARLLADAAREPLRPVEADYLEALDRALA